MYNYWEDPWPQTNSYRYVHVDPANPPNEGLTLTEAVQKLKDNGGSIRRPRWECNDFLRINHHEDRLTASYAYVLSGVNQLSNLLATDWIWEAGNE